MISFSLNYLLFQILNHVGPDTHHCDHCDLGAGTQQSHGDGINETYMDAPPGGR